jgi:hypothetical protein
MSPRLFRAVLPALALAIFIPVHLSAAPFAVALTDNASVLAAAILGPGTTLVGTPTLSGQSGQPGTFMSFQNGSVFIPSGVLLTTGIVSGAEGSYIGGPSYDAGGSGDAMLTALIGGPTFDADILQFSFTSTSSTLLLRFLFATGDYPTAGGREWQRDLNQRLGGFPGSYVAADRPSLRCRH